jgi:hypothetical protein
MGGIEKCAPVGVTSDDALVLLASIGKRPYMQCRQYRQDSRRGLAGEGPMYGI